MVTTIGKDLATQIVQTVKDVCGQDVNFIDASGTIFASTDEKRIGTFHEIGQKVARTGTPIEVDTDNDYLGTHKGINLPIYHNYGLLAVIGITGAPDEVRKYAHLAERITKLLIRERELGALSKNQAEQRHYLIDALIRNDTSNLDYRNHLLEEFKVSLSTNKRILLLQINPRYNLTNISMLDQIVFPFFKKMTLSLYAFQYPNQYVAIMEEETFEKNRKTLESFARNQRDLLNIAIGKMTHLSDLQLSFETSLIAMRSLMDVEKNYAIFDDLTLEIVLSAIDDKAKEEYQRKLISALDEKDLELLRVYFDEDMSLARTSERMYIHKNTLQYKLNSIHTRTGFNPRKFEDAVLLYLAIRM